MISKSDSYNTIEMKNCYAILNNDNKKLEKYYKNNFNAKKVEEGFEYSSDLNPDFMKITDLKK